MVNGSIAIRKTTIGGDGTFEYTVTPPINNIATFEITTSGGEGTYLLQNIPSGNYTISELGQIGWISVGADSYNTNVTFNQTNNLVFVNTNDYGFITIQKETSGDDGTFNFITNPLGISATITTVQGSGSTGFYLPSNNYTITEIGQTGWTGTSQQNILVTSGSTGSVLFVNTNLGTLVIDKTIVGSTGATGSFDFTINPAAAGITGFNISIGTGTTGSFIITDVPIGSYFVQELGQPGWTASPTGATGNVSAGATTTIQFINTGTTGNTGTLVVNKTIVGSTGATGSFDFIINPAAAGITGFNISIGTGTTGSFVITNVTEGGYFVQELGQTGWTTSPTGATGNVINGGTATLDFTNTQISPTGNTGTLVVNKTIVGSTGATGSFDFTINPAAAGITGFNITIGTGTTGSFVITDVTEGGYFVQELGQIGWIASPTGATGNVTNGGTGIVNFTNTENNPIGPTGTLVVNKRIIGATGLTGSFDFTINPAAAGVTGFNITIGTGTTGSFIITNVNEGEYFVQELGQTGWVASPTGNTGTVPSGGTATVNIANVRNGTLIISKTVLPFDPIPPDATFNYTITGTGYTGATSITVTGGVASFVLLPDLAPGIYTVTEEPTVDWTVIFPPTGVVAVDITGGTGSAIFVNRYTPP